MAHVLIGFAEALPAPEVVFSLLSAGHEVSAFARSRRLPLAHLPLKQLFVEPDALRTPESVVTRLRKIMAGPESPDVVLPVDDAGLWVVDAALGVDPRVAGATGAQARIALDKVRQLEIARTVGLNVPDTVIFDPVTTTDFSPPVPAILKPSLAISAGARGLEKGRSCYLTSSTAAAAARALLAKATQPYLAQPLIEGTGEGIFGFACNGDVVAWSGHRRLRMMNPHGSGASACMAVRPDADACEGVRRFLCQVDWKGPFMMEFLRDRGGRLWFVEMNGRMWGSMALARRHGLEYPAWAVDATLHREFCPEVPPACTTRHVVRNLGRDILHLFFVLRGPKTDIHRKAWPGFARALLEVCRPAPLRSFYNYDPAHRGYVFRDAIWTIRSALKS
jgi:hypothetical protein